MRTQSKITEIKPPFDVFVMQTPTADDTGLQSNNNQRHTPEIPNPPPAFCEQENPQDTLPTTDPQSPPPNTDAKNADDKVCLDEIKTMEGDDTSKQDNDDDDDTQSCILLEKPKDLHGPSYVAEQCEMQLKVIKKLPDFNEESLILPTGRLNLPEFKVQASGLKKVINILNRKVYYGDLEEYRHTWSSSLVCEKDFALLSNSEILAAQYNPRMLQKLLAQNPTVASARDSLWGYTLLHWACKTGSHESISLLIAHGADINARTFNGQTPLHLAAINSDPEVLELLLKAGAQVHIETFSGIKARDLACGDAKYFLQASSNCLDYKLISDIISRGKSNY